MGMIRRSFELRDFTSALRMLYIKEAWLRVLLIGVFKYRYRRNDNFDIGEVDARGDVTFLFNVCTSFLNMQLSKRGTNFRGARKWNRVLAVHKSD